MYGEPRWVWQTQCCGSWLPGEAMADLEECGNAHMVFQTLQDGMLSREANSSRHWVGSKCDVRRFPQGTLKSTEDLTLPQAISLYCEGTTEVLTQLVGMLPCGPSLLVGKMAGTIITILALLLPEVIHGS